MTNFWRITVYALLFSLAAHFALAGFFSLRIPIKDVPFKPSINFLGSFLTSDDTQGAHKTPPDLSHQKRQVLLLPEPQTSARHITPETPRAVLFSSLPASTKKTLPALKSDPASDAKDAHDVQPFKNETFEYKPLKLPEYDHY